MKKTLVNLIILTTLIVILLITILSTFGIETNKFNRFITDKVSETKNMNNIDDKFEEQKKENNIKQNFASTMYKRIIAEISMLNDN